MTHKTYSVRCETTCPACKGSGTVKNPLWEKFWEEFGERGCQMQTSEIKAWFWQTFGWYDDQLPTEQETCVECEGDCVIVQEVELGEAIRDMGISFQTATKIMELVAADNAFKQMDDKTLSMTVAKFIQEFTDTVKGTKNAI